MPTLISKTQAAFIEGEVIFNNTLIARELLHVLKSPTKYYEEFVAMKTYISNTYEKVDVFSGSCFGSPGFFYQIV